MKQSDGFTMVELITIIVILGVLAVVALPRVDTSEYRAQEFHDRVVAALRYGQKTATSHRRLVCVGFTASSVALRIARNSGAANCDADLPLPGSTSNEIASPDPTNIVFTATTPSDLNFVFLPDGSAADRTLALGSRSISVIGTTGHVQ